MQQDLLNCLEKLHSRAGRIIYRLPWDMSSENVLARAGWVPLSAMYKNRLDQFVYRAVNGLVPQEMLSWFRTKAMRYNLKNRHALILSRPETNYSRNSKTNKGATLWNSSPANIKSVDGKGNF